MSAKYYRSSGGRRWNSTYKHIVIRDDKCYLVDDNNNEILDATKSNDQSSINLYIKSGDIEEFLPNEDSVYLYDNDDLYLLCNRLNTK